MILDKRPDVKADPEKMVKYVLHRFSNLKLMKQRWTSRRQRFLDTYENFLRPKSDLGYESVAKVRVQVTEWMRQTIHSYLLHAIFGMDPPFAAVPEGDSDKALVETVEKTMKWTIDKYANYGAGIREAADDWVDDLVSVGFGIMKLRWDVVERYTKRLDVQADLAELRKIVKDKQKLEAYAQDKMEEGIFTVFDGPVLEPVDVDDIYFPARSIFPTDINRYSIVIHRLRKDANWIKQRVAVGTFDPKAAELVLSRSEDGWALGDKGTETKDQRDKYAGTETQWHGPKGYEVIEAYFDYPSELDPKDGGHESGNDNETPRGKMGITERLVATIHPESKQLLSVTYVDLVNPTGNFPFYKIDFHKRRGRTHSRGLPETVYQVQKEADILHNIALDFGILNAMPFGLYKPMAGATTDVIKLKPGILLPATDPSTDMAFPYRPQTQNWPTQMEHQAIQYAAKSSFVNELMMGQMPSPVGGARSTSGMNTLLGQIGINHEKLLTRVTGVYSRMLVDLYAMLQVRMPEGVKTRLGSGISGPGKTSRADLGGVMNFKPTANAMNVNKQFDVENAMLYVNLLMSRPAMETGIVSPGNMYNILLNVLKKRGEVDPNMFITRPQDADQPLSIKGELDSIMQGEMPRVAINDRHQDKIDAIEEFIASDKFKTTMAEGQVSPAWQIIYRQLIKAHKAMDEMLKRSEQMANYAGTQAPMQEKGGSYGGIGQTPTPGAGGEIAGD